MKSRAPFAILVYLIAANIPLWIASRSMGLGVKGVFNIEFALVGILSVFLPRSLTGGLLLGTIALDLLSCLSNTYMLTPSELLRSVGSLVEYAPSHRWGIAVFASGALLICLAAILASRQYSADKDRRYVVSTLTIFALLCVAVDCSRGQIAALRPDHKTGQIRLVRVPTKSLITAERQKREIGYLSSTGTNSHAVAASATLAGLTLGTSSLRTNSSLPNVVFVLVESWGKPVSREVDESLLEPYRAGKLLEKYTVSRGTIPFYGPTVDAESRELCGSGMGFGVITASAVQLKSCLPSKFDSMGYHTIAVHGFSSRMFERNEWYPRIGFDETWFRDQLQEEGLPLCPGAFPGICDSAISAWIGNQLQKNSGPPQLIYWLTLNSHLPVPVPNYVQDPPSCTAQDPAICSWSQLIFNVHRSVTELAMRPTARPTVFVVVGDHAPPFSSQHLRDQFSDQVVEYVLLQPKRNSMRDNSQSRGSIAEVPRPLAESPRSSGKKG